MSQFIKFYFTSSVLNMFRTIIHTSSGACDFSIASPHLLCVNFSMCVGVSVWLVGVVSVWQASACHTDTTVRILLLSSPQHSQNMAAEKHDFYARIGWRCRRILCASVRVSTNSITAKLILKVFDIRKFNWIYRQNSHLCQNLNLTTEILCRTAG